MRSTRLFVALFAAAASACAAQQAPKPLGAGKQLGFVEFKQAAEHYEPGVTPSNTLALQGAADSYAAYLGAFHRHLHPEYAVRFLGARKDAFTDLTLMTKIEVVIEADGSLNRLGVVKTSGNALFDHEAFNAVLRGAPYPAPPSEIHSPDGRTYLRWSLYRGESQCGTWNAEPYILKSVLLPTPAPSQ